MSDDETRPNEPASQSPSQADAAPQPEPHAAPPYAGQPAYPMPLPAGFIGYGQTPPAERPRFADQVLGMRSVVVVAVACLIIGGLSGFILGNAADHGDDRFGPGPGFVQRGPFSDGRNGFPDGPNGIPNQPFGQGRSGS
jgi:hypothetical protein